MPSLHSKSLIHLVLCRAIEEAGAGHPDFRRPIRPGARMSFSAQTLAPGEAEDLEGKRVRQALRYGPAIGTAWHPQARS
jgi:hypothetical protein